MVRNTSVMGIYPDRITVSDAVNVLQKEGYRTTDISILASDNPGSKDFAHEKRSKAPEGAALAAAAGAVLGAALAWFASIQTAGSIAGLGSLAAAGPVLAALAGAGAGGAVGWIAGLAGRHAPDRVRSEAICGTNQARRHSPFRSLRHSGVVCPGKEELEGHRRAEHLLRRGVCRRLWHHG